MEGWCGVAGVRGPGGSLRVLEGCAAAGRGFFRGQVFFGGVKNLVLAK